LCAGGNTGSILVTPSGGVGPFDFSIDGGTSYNPLDAATHTFTSLTAGVYNIRVRDANNCETAVLPVTITEPTPVAVLSTSKTDATCLGLNDGTIQVNSVSGGTPGYQYSSDNGVTFQPGNTFSSLAPGNYQVVVSDANGCLSPATLITINSGVTITISNIVTTDASCAGVNDGSITINTITGGTGPYEYSIDNGVSFQPSNSFTGLGVGTYQVIGRDNNNCESVVSLVTINSSVTITFTATPTDATCLGVNDGSIAISGETGGTSPYEYSIDGVTFGSTSTFTSLAPQVYPVQIRDAVGCISASFPVTVNSGTTITITTLNTVDATCSGVNDGQIDIAAVAGGIPPYSYSIDNGSSFQPTALFTNLTVGNYDVVVRDANLCLSAPVAVPINSTLVITPTITTSDASCGGASDGAITVTSVSGGLVPYEYSLDGGAFQTSNVFSGLTSGNYDIVVRDANTCTSSAVTVTVNNALSITPTIIRNDATCLGNDGSIVISAVSGGTAPYQYSIDGGANFQTSNTFSNLTAGTYPVVVLDDNGCQSNPIPTIISIPGGCPGLNCFAYTITVDPVLTQRPTCANQNDGVLVINVAGVTPGNYIIQLLKPSDPSFTALSQVGPSGTYTFSALSPGNYEYSLLDQVGNFCVQPYSLPVETNVSALAAGFVDASCFGQPTGQATLTVTSGGVSPYEYSIDNGVTYITFTSPVTITNLPPNGTYSILVRDDASDACPAEVAVTINSATPQITQAFTVQAATCNNNDGKIVLTGAPGGGSGGPYSYLLNGIPTAPVANEFANLGAGAYVLSVVDNTGCQQDFNTTVTFPGFVNTSAITVTPPDCASNGTNGSIAFTILDIGVFEFAITTDPLYVPVDADYILTGGSLVIIPDLPNGTYYVWVRSSGSTCPTKLLPVAVQGVYAVSFSAASTNEICFNDGGIIDLTGITGAPATDFSYELVTGGVPAVGTITSLEALGTYSITGLAPGDYQVRVNQDQTALNGCVVNTSFVSFTIEGPDAPLDTLAVEYITESFPDQPTGSMLVVIQESMEEPYELKVELTDPLTGGQFFLRDFETVERNSGNLRMEDQLNLLYAGTYELTIRDDLGCEVVRLVDIPVDTDIFIPNLFTPNNDGANDKFFVRNLPEGAQLIISSRWGNEVYSSSNYPTDFNSPDLWNGGEAPDGIYYYRLQAGGMTFTGWVEILRGTKP
jgi:uncharacterized protein (DUF2141 family)